MKKEHLNARDFLPRVAVLLPCHNEEAAIAEVVHAFRKALPEADVIVCNNASKDNTKAIALECGAIVIDEPRRGKANAVRRLFQSVDADVYLLCDGDLTYDASASTLLVKQIVDEDLSMIVGARVPKAGHQTYRRGHSLGNFIFTIVLKLFFGGNFSDVLSGYRGFSRAFVKSFPILSKGFDIEVEITAHALATGVSIGEVNVEYSERPEGSVSKLHTYKDGLRIASTILRLVLDYQPLRVFFVFSFLQILTAVIIFQPVLQEYLITGLVERLPTAVFCVGLMITGILTGFCGVILDSFSRQRIEAKKLAFLAQSSQRKIR